MLKWTIIERHTKVSIIYFAITYSKIKKGDFFIDINEDGNEKIFEAEKNIKSKHNKIIAYLEVPFDLSKEFTPTCYLHGLKKRVKLEYLLNMPFFSLVDNFDYNINK